MNNRLLLIALSTLQATGNASSTVVPSECKDISESIARLECYDEWARTQSEPATATPDPVAQEKTKDDAQSNPFRWFVKTTIDPVRPADEAKLKDLPATLSLSRHDGENFVDARSAVLGQFKLGDFEETSGFIGLQWTRSETPEKRSDARTLGFGLLHYIQSDAAVSTWWATLEPRISYTTDIARNEQTTSIKLATDFGHFLYSEGEVIEASNPRKIPFWFTFAAIGRHVNAEMGPDRDFALAQLTANIGWQPHDRLYFRAQPSVQHHFDAPSTFDDSGIFGIIAAEWDLSSGPESRWKPSLLLSRSFGENSSDPDYIPNLTKLSFAIRFDSAPPPKTQ